MKLSSEQVELQDVLRRFFGEHVTSEYLRHRIASKERSDAKMWDTLRQLGLDEGFSGTEPVFGIEELALVAEESGCVLLPEPLIERVFATYIVPRLMPQDERSKYAGVIGSRKTAIAPNQCCALEARESGDVVSGEIAWALGCEEATHILAFAETSQGRRAVVCSLEGAGVSVVATESLDLTRSLSRVTVKDHPALVLGAEASAAIEDVFELLKAAEMSGISQRVIAMTSDYVKTREQFGVPVGSFQAIQHKLADLYAASESLTSLCRFAAWSAVHSPEQRRLTCRAAILKAAEVAPQVCEVSLQCHGGIGFTWEYDLHLFLRRAKALQAAFSITERRAEELLNAISY